MTPPAGSTGASVRAPLKRQRAFEKRFRFIEPLLPPLSEVMKHYSPSYENGLITNGNVVARLEAAVAERLCVKYCVAVSSCTSGLMMVLRALGLSGEVIVPSFTFFATGHAILWNELVPVFADCDPDTWNVDPLDIERKITGRTSAIVAVHMYGNPCAIERLEDLAKERDLKLVFDSAHAFGSAYRQIPVGSFGDVEVFSLSPTKLLIAGEGGLVTTNDATLAKAIRAMRVYGDLGSYNPQWLGMSARMPEFNAAMALAGLALVEAKIKRRNEIAAMYTEVLSSVPGIRFQRVHSSDVHTFKDYSIHIAPSSSGITRDDLAEALLIENIETKKYFYPPLHKQDLYRPFHDIARGSLSQTTWVTDNILSLPVYESLPDATINTVAQAIKSLVS